MWNGYHDPSFLTEAGRKQLIDPYPIEEIENVRRMSKRTAKDGVSILLCQGYNRRHAHHGLRYATPAYAPRG
jgi:hypothetical protein